MGSYLGWPEWGQGSQLVELVMVHHGGAGGNGAPPVVVVAVMVVVAFVVLVLVEAVVVVSWMSLWGSVESSHIGCQPYGHSCEHS